MFMYCTLWNLLFVIFKFVSCWNKNDIDSVLEKGDLLYKSKNTFRYLSCPELPRLVNVAGLNVSVTFIHDYFGIAHRVNIVNIVTQFNALHTFTGILFIIKGVVYSIIPCNSHVYLVDSQC